ncbi:hypothetical protein DENSPDRAFT_846064 [Dentipellis sp. KUC8613]|nr:hypothetical protein DENSPDRAFT_846064 [Dentipellis sp. KUC8613]
MALVSFPALSHAPPRRLRAAPHALNTPPRSSRPVVPCRAQSHSLRARLALCVQRRAFSATPPRRRLRAPPRPLCAHSRPLRATLRILSRAVPSARSTALSAPGLAP